MTNKVAGTVKQIRQLITKRQERMAVIELDLFGEAIRIVLFPRNYHLSLGLEIGMYIEADGSQLGRSEDGIPILAAKKVVIPKVDKDKKIDFAKLFPLDANIIIKVMPIESKAGKK